MTEYIIPPQIRAIKEVAMVSRKSIVHLAVEHGDPRCEWCMWVSDMIRNAGIKWNNYITDAWPRWINDVWGEEY